MYVSENKKIATKLVGQIGFVDPKKGLPIELQHSGYIGNISYSNQAVKIQGVPFSEVFNAKDGRKILYDINKITEVKDADGASVPLKNGMGAAETITSAIDESIPKSNDDVNDAFEQSIKVLQKINGIDISSELVEEIGNGRLIALLKKGKLVKP